MRADRLLSMLMFLQTRGQTTTHRLAREFEVSRRTILRDLYALRVAGFPVCTVSGPGGGCSLDDRFRNTLTHLTTDEIATLLLSSIQQPLRDLGLSDPLCAARLKLTAAAREPSYATANRLAKRTVIDSSPWSARAEPTDFLPVLHQASMQDRWVRVVFERPFGVVTSRRIAPYGLVAKAGAWFVVWAGEDGFLRVDRISRINEAELERGRFERPEVFDLDAYWAAWRDRQEQARPTFDVRIRVRKHALNYVLDALGKRHGVPAQSADESDEWADLDVSFSFFEEARRKLLAFGGAVEVMRPKALRVSMADFARQIGRRYLDGELDDG